MTSGDKSGMSGRLDRQVFWAAFGMIAAFILIQTTVNGYSLRHDRPDFGPWKPFVWEYTSAALAIPLALMPAFLLARFPPGRGRWLRFVLVNVAATVVFCLIHTLGFTALRKLVYWALGAGAYDGFDLLYEYPKDLAAYLAWLAVFWTAGLLSDRIRKPQTPPADGLFDIRDGAKVIRTPVSGIVAASSAGNYVEFLLADGRKPLMRATLASVEAALTDHGFVRTHRSWLINPLRVRGLTPEGSGDFRVALDGGGDAPLSRRFPAALETLRSPEARA